ncbi:MAG: arylsulfatase A-like enzyme [Verrucomicrobiales bacterium]
MKEPLPMMKHLFLACLLSCSLRAADKPNIVFIFTDDHAIQTIGAYGSRLSDFCKKHNITPNLDKMAADGGLFVNSLCANSLCSPSRAAILTGLHAHTNGVMTLGRPITEGLWTYPTAIKAAGYQTAVVGKWHLGNTPAKTDHWLLLKGQGDYYHPTFEGPEGQEQIQGYATDLITDMGLDWLGQRDKDKPFMLMVQHKAPHRPFSPPARYYDWLADVEVPEPDTLFDDYEGRASPAHNQKMEIDRHMNFPTDLKVLEKGQWAGQVKRLNDAERTKWLAAFGPRNEAFLKATPEGKALVRWKYQEYLKDYLRCIKAVDDGVGRIADYLEKEDLSENTVLIYSSDQGFYMGEHGWFDKRWIYEESLHMPLIVRWPGVVKPGSRFTQLVQNIDYASTFVEMAGGETPAGRHGRSIVPLLKGETPVDWRKSVYYHYYDRGHGVPRHYGIRTDRYTLVHFYETDDWELYDLEKDPQQMRSVYAMPDYADTLTKLKAELIRQKTHFKDESDRTPLPGHKKKPK